MSIRLEAIVTRLEAIASRLEAIASRVEAIAIRLLLLECQCHYAPILCDAAGAWSNCSPHQLGSRPDCSQEAVENQTISFASLEYHRFKSIIQYYRFSQVFTSFTALWKGFTPLGVFFCDLRLEQHLEKTLREQMDEDPEFDAPASHQ